MSQDKIENIFSELENFSSVPPPELWNAIEEKLEQPKKKNKGFLWWSVAANILFVASIPMVWYFLMNKQETQLDGNSEGKNEITLVKKNSDSVKNQSVVVLDSNLNDKNENSVLTVKRDSTEIVSKDKIYENNIKTSRKESVVSEKSNIVIVNSVKEKDSNSNNNNSIVKENLVSRKSKIKEFNTLVKNDSVSDDVSSKNNPENLGKEKVVKVKSKIIVASITKNDDSNLNENSTKNNPENLGKEEVIKVKSKIIVAGITKNNNSNESSVENNPEKSEKSTSDKSKITETAYANKEKRNSGLKENSNKNRDILSPNDTLKDNVIVDAKTQKEASQFKTDSLSKINTEKQKIALELLKLESINKKKDLKKKLSQPIDKWSLDVFAGVAATQNTPNSALGSEIKNIQSNSYGIKTNVALSSRWSVSSGFKLNELGQNTNNVAYFENVSNPTLAVSNGYYDNYGNWKESITAQNINRDFSKESLAVVALTDNSTVSFVAENSAKQTPNNSSIKKGDVSQITKYIEMPLEVSYAIISKKKVLLKMNTGGFLGKLVSNKTYLNGDYLGKNTTVNDFIYGTKLSSTLQYEFYKKTHFFVEPGVNYYMNTTKNDTFKPIQLMLNFGVNVSF
jgi:hypothetical protein